MPRILIVEDNEDVRRNIVEFLELKKFKTDNTDDGLKALGLTLVNSYDLILLDVMIPGLDGISVCEQLKKRMDSTPIIFLSAKDTVEDRINGLTVGADDYIVKTFSLSELLLRINAVLRRTKKELSPFLTIGPLKLNAETKQVFRDDKEIRVNPTGFKILQFLMSKSPNIVSREELEKEIWGFNRVASDALRAQIHLLRQLVDKPFEKQLIHTRQGFGWSIKAEEKDAGES